MENETTYRVEDRAVRRAVSGDTQRTQSFSSTRQTGEITSMVNADTHRFIRYDDRGLDTEGNSVEFSTRPSKEIPELQNRAATGKEPCSPSAPNRYNRTGTVDLESYMRWLLDNGYEF